MMNDPLLLPTESPARHSRGDSSSGYLDEINVLDESIDALALFFRMLEWTEIEGAVLQSYDELVHQQRLFQEANGLLTLDAILKEVDRIVGGVMAGFFNEFNFAVGVLNCIVVSIVFAAYPEHFWLLYLVQGLYLLPRNLYDRVNAKPLNRVFSYADYCWLMNTVALLSLIFLVLHSIAGLPFSDLVRKELFVVMIGTACGPLMGAALVLPFVALMFHSIDTMTGFFIHVFPPMVCFTLRWYPERVHEAYPSVFKLDYLSEVHYFFDGSWFYSHSVAGRAIACYVVWFIPYTIWMLRVGLDLPRNDRLDSHGNMIVPQYDTCFHVGMRGGACLAIGKKFRGRSNAESLRQMETNHFEKKDLFIYMTLHATMVLFSILVLGSLCYTSKAFHMSFLCLLAAICAFRGAKRYTYYITNMYSRMLRRHFDVLRQENSCDDFGQFLLMRTSSLHQTVPKLRRRGSW